MQKILILGFFIINLITVSFAEVVEYNLVIDKRVINIDGKTTMGMTINGSIPGPVLRFKEGDIARIHVHNNLDEETSIHWHGVLVPPEMDGVPYVSFPPIKPKSTFTYEFTIRQNGTYWYHSHSGLQEQNGIYGAIVIEPKDRNKNFHYDREYVVLLSDWTVDDPHEVLRTLKRGSEWFSISKGNAQSIIGSAKLGMVSNYLKRELLRMPEMDLSDVAYDYFLANGKPEISYQAKIGETILIRLINGSAMTYFHVEFAGGLMTIISSDGQNVEPLELEKLLVAVAETYDFLIKIPSDGQYELRASAHDASGYASVWFGEGEKVYANNIPKPNLYYFMDKVTIDKLFALTPSAVMGMSDKKVNEGIFDRLSVMMEMHDHEKMDSIKVEGHSDVYHTSNHEDMIMKAPMTKEELTQQRYGKKFANKYGLLASDVASSEKFAVDGMDPSRPGTPYEKLRSVRPAVYPSDTPIQEIRLTLDGDMKRYVWFLNNKPLSESDVIRIKSGHLVRLIMINRTMMHHPMHLHGHLFRVINTNGEYSPLKHTVDVAPMSTTVIEFYSNEPGDWFFHCHLLYHMKTGMSKVLHYEGFTLNQELEKIRHEIYKDPLYGWGTINVLSNLTYGSLVVTNTRNIITAEWEAGWQRIDSIDWETIFTWDRYFNRFFTTLAGVHLRGFGNNVNDSQLVVGIRYLLPLNIETMLWLDSDGGGRINFNKSLVLVPRLRLSGEIQYDTHDEWEGKVSIAYILNKSISIVGLWHSSYGLGAGFQYRF